MESSDNAEGSCKEYESWGVDDREIRSVTEAGVLIS